MTQKETKKAHETKNSHLDCPVSPTTDQLVCNEVDAIHLVCVSREVCLEFVRLEVPDLTRAKDISYECPIHSQPWNIVP